MNRTLVLSACALAAAAALDAAQAQSTALPTDPAASAPPTTQSQTVVVTARRAQRVSAGATGLPLEVKETPQSISTIDAAQMADFGATGANDALRLGTGINVEAYETNRVVYNARGFEIQSTQIDGLGMSNSWGTVVGQLDTYVFERIELIRGANGLLTGVGNASGTINYVRKRPLNTDAAEFVLGAGSYGTTRAALDVSKVLADDGSWAGRLVVAYEDGDSYLRALHDRRGTVYGVVDGQIGTDGVLTLGFTHRESNQDSPMWGSLTLNYVDGTMAEFDVSSSTSQDWTYWNTRSDNVFAEYSHALGNDWTAKFTLSHTRSDESTKLLYAYTDTGGLELDNTGLQGWPYRSFTVTEDTLVDANLSGRFTAFGGRHELIAGISRSRQTSATDTWATGDFMALPAFPYAGDVYPEPTWAPRAPTSDGGNMLTRVYAATRLSLTDRLKGVVGVNAIRLHREGNSRYGEVITPTAYPDTEEVSPYLGVTYALTPEVTGYASYSDIFQNQDQLDIGGRYLDPVKGVNVEVGVKAEWLGRRLLTTAALFTAEQTGLATFAGIDGDGQYYYEGKDVRSRGIELEATGRLSADSRLTLGLTHMKLTGPDGGDIYEWVPRTTLNLGFDTRLAALPKLRLGIAGRWQSDVRKAGGAWQDAYAVADGFVAWELDTHTTVRLNVTNLFDRKYVQGLAYGAIYGAPRHAMLTVSYAL